MSSEMLLLSNSALHGMGFLEHAMGAVRELLDGRDSVLFVPYAMRDHDGYTVRVQEALRPLGVAVTGLHTARDAWAAVEAASVLFVGGGNSFRLAGQLQRLDLIEIVRERVTSGALGYIGSSTGTNMACPSLRTTNDMPIVEPASFATFGLIPFQINPHYLDPDPSSTHMGETRERRIIEFLEENDVAVLGLREGAWLHRSDHELRLEGLRGARLFRRNAEPEEFAPGADLSHLLTLQPRFDQPA